MWERGRRWGVDGRALRVPGSLPVASIQQKTPLDERFFAVANTSRSDIEKRALSGHGEDRHIDAPAVPQQIPSGSKDTFRITSGG